MIKMRYLVECVVLRPHRLMVRTSGSQPGNSGSIPGGVTKFKIKAKLLS